MSTFTFLDLHPYQNQIYDKDKNTNIYIYIYITVYRVIFIIHDIRLCVETHVCYVHWYILVYCTPNNISKEIPIWSTSSICRFLSCISVANGGPFWIPGIQVDFWVYINPPLSQMHFQGLRKRDLISFALKCHKPFVKAANFHSKLKENPKQIVGALSFFPLPYAGVGKPIKFRSLAEAGPRSQPFQTWVCLAQSAWSWDSRSRALRLLPYIPPWLRSGHRSQFCGIVGTSEPFCRK